MDLHDKYRYEENFNWFDKLFKDTRVIFETIYNSLPEGFEDKEKGDTSPLYYYPTQKKIRMHNYYFFSVRGSKYALQVISTYNLQIAFGDNSEFVKDYSIIIVLHNDRLSHGWYNDFILKIIKNEDLQKTIMENKVFSGVVKNRKSKTGSADFHAMQVFWHEFSSDKDIKTVIQERIIKAFIRKYGMD